MTEQIGLYKFKLTQKRYKDGAFYLSAILDAGQAKALDGRFVIEEGNALTPTKNGFRIPVEKLYEFRKALAGDLRDLQDTIIIDNRAFKFHVRYVNDKFGEGIDFRKYKTTDKYTGWDRSGIRMKLEDVATMCDWLSDFDAQAIRASQNLFAGKEFGRKEHDDSGDVGTRDLTVNPDIKKLLDF